VSKLTVASLVGIRILCKLGCTVVFTETACYVFYQEKIILTGYKDPSMDLWELPITPDAINKAKLRTSQGQDMVPVQSQASPCTACLSWKFCFFRCRLQLVLKTCLRVFPTRWPDTADVSATSCDVGFFFSFLYVVSLPNCRHVVVGSNYSTHLSCLLRAKLFSCSLWYLRIMM
jgi:hypothetical protein